MISSDQLVPEEINVPFFQNFANESSYIMNDPDGIQHLVEKSIFKLKNHLSILLIKNKAGTIWYFQK